MNLQKLTNAEILQLLNDVKQSEELQYVPDESMLRKYMDTLNPTIALVQAPIDIWREASSRWKFTMDSITWIEGAGVGVIKRK